ncbi:MAG: hypothetical protein GC131_09605 [Alphaproteobacteria bacterium]|nr:hypothetical protein [Alphaproteobacteria bacterium]
MLPDIFRALRQMQLKDSESRIVIALMRRKDGMFVHDLVKQTKLPRSSVVLILKRLFDRSLVTKIKEGRRLKYRAQSPEHILFSQEQLVENLRELVPFLKRMGASDKVMDVQFLDGPEGIRQIYRDMLLNFRFAEGPKRELYEIASGADALKVFPDMPQTFIRRRIQMGVPIRIIAPDTSRHVPVYISDSKELREVKYFDGRAFPFRVSFDIYADNISTYSTVPPVGGVIIRSEQLADSMRSLFNLLWQTI